MNKEFICEMCKKVTDYNRGHKWNSKSYCIVCLPKAKEQCQEYDVSDIRKKYGKEN